VVFIFRICGTIIQSLDDTEYYVQHPGLPYTVLFLEETAQMTRKGGVEMSRSRKALFGNAEGIQNGQEESERAENGPNK
jgi:hypothetical protein